LRRRLTWRRRPRRDVTLEDRGRFLLDYIDLLLHERVDESRAVSHDRWVVNKLRALGSWYTKGLENGSHLRTAINGAESLQKVRDTIGVFFSSEAVNSST
jgi:tRNA-dihydrouridine synthase